VPFERALAWIDSINRCLDTEEVPLAAAADRVLAVNLHTPAPIPAADSAATDGFAVFAADSLGAGAYNPLAVRAEAIEAGEPMPPGKDAVVPFDQAEPEGSGSVTLVEPIVAGANVDCRGAVAGAGQLLAAAVTRLTPRHLGLLASAGFDRLPVLRRPQVRLVVAGTMLCEQAVDGNRPMLRGLIASDGGVVVEADLAEAFAGGVDIVVIAGGTGRGARDRSVAALAAAGSLDIHGVALIPGDTAGFGYDAGGVPVLLLPGSPAACLWNYELFAGRAIRRRGGYNPELPYRCAAVTTARKIVSPIGMTEVCAVRRLAHDQVEPAGSFAECGLWAAVAADGFVIIPAASEGYPAGAAITAYFYADRPLPAIAGVEGGGAEPGP
jgi:molybdopterin molybdotransferase